MKTSCFSVFCIFAEFFRVLCNPESHQKPSTSGTGRGAKPISQPTLEENCVSQT